MHQYILDKEGNPLFDLNSRKKVVVKKYKGMTLVDIRDTFEKNGETIFTQKGVSLTLEVYEKLKEMLPSIDRAI